MKRYAVHEGDGFLQIRMEQEGGADNLGADQSG